MKPSCAAAILGGGILLLSHTASAQSGWYATGSAGLLLRGDYNFDTTFRYSGTSETSPGTNTASYNPGVNLDLGLGYRLPIGLRFEGALGYGHYGTDSASPNAYNGIFPTLNGTKLSNQSGGDHDQITVTVAGYYDLPISWPAVPYVGLGLGYYQEAVSDAHFAVPGGGTFTMGSHAADGALLLAEAGLTIPVSGAWSIVPAYRYEHMFVSGRPDFDIHILKVGFRYAF